MTQAATALAAAEPATGPDERIVVWSVQQTLEQPDNDALLDQLTATPALATMERTPQRLRPRVAELARDIMNAHTAAEWQALRGGHGATARARRASQLLWLLPSLVLRNKTSHAAPEPLDSTEAPQVGARASDYSRLVRGSFCEVEAGWAKHSSATPTMPRRRPSRAPGLPACALPPCRSSPSTTKRSSERRPASLAQAASALPSTCSQA